MSFEAPAMEVMGLIQRWRDQAGEERRAKGLKVSAEKKKKKKKKVTWQVRIGWCKTHILRQLLTQCFLKTKRSCMLGARS